MLSAEIRTSFPNEFGLTLARLGPSWEMDGKYCKGNVRSFPHSPPEAHLIVPVFCCEVFRCFHKTCVWAYFHPHAHHCWREEKLPNAEGWELVTWWPCHGGPYTRCAIDCTHLHNFFGIKLLGECFCGNRFSPVRKKNTLEFLFPFFHSPCLASTGKSHSFVWWTMTAFQNSLPESPRDLLFSSFLI